MKKTIQQIWLEELKTLKEKYILFKEEKNIVTISKKIVKKPKQKKL